jgi:hypothetical protein
MKRTAIITIIALTLAGPALATEFWETYANTLVYNYSIKAGAIPAEGVNERLTSNEAMAVVTKSFSQSFGQRFGEVAHNNSPLLLVCAFSREADKCFMDSVMGSLFGEIKIVNPPQFSEKFLRKTSRFYTTTFMDNKSTRGVHERSRGVPARKNFNPRFGFSLSEPEFVAAVPFYSFLGIYVEPKYGTRNGPSVSLMKDRAFVNFDKEGVSLKYRFPKSVSHFDVDNLTLTIRPEGEVTIDNVFIVW